MPFKRRRRHNPTSPAKPLTAAQVERLLYGQSIPDKHQRERLEQARKEFQVPDLQSELSKIANAWDDQENEIRKEQPKEKAMTFTPSGNVSRDTFHFIQANPCKYTPSSACKALTAMGYKYGSVHSLLTQLKRIEYIKSNVDGELFTAVSEYKPFQNPYKKNPVNKKKAKPVKAIKIHTPKSAGIAALQPAEIRTVPAAWDADTVLAHIGVKEAFKLYEALSKMFGGK